jgi:hypothetical protein
MAASQDRPSQRQILTHNIWMKRPMSVGPRPVLRVIGCEWQDHESRIRTGGQRMAPRLVQLAAKLYF